MSNALNPTDDGTTLRARAEERLTAREVETGRPDPDTRRLMHELDVHQIELELQNEELRGARLALEAGLARYTELFDFAPIGYATLGQNDLVSEINHTGALLLGSPRARLVGRPFAMFVAPSDRPRFASFVARALTSVIKQSGELQLVTSAGQIVHVRLSAITLVRNEPMVMIAFEDITDRKLKEEQLRLTEQALRDADRRKDEFLGVLSHELRNPLAPIRNGIFLLAQSDTTPEQAARAHAIIDRQVTHLTRLIDDLLDVTRIRRGKIQLQQERVELSELVRKTLEDQRSSFEHSGVGLEANFEPEAMWLSADAARVTQVLSNLLGNAEKFTPRGGVVTVDLHTNGTKAVLRVHDTGAGIAPAVLEHLFEPFAQAPQTMDRARGGLGLGLTMVKGLVELHGGTVTIFSAGAGLGTEVTVLLPLDTAPTNMAAKGVRGSSFSRRVIVIEDNVDGADTLKDALAFFGHDVRVAYDGATGLERARAFQPEVVLCDIGLPGMDGYAVARAFRADEGLKRTYLVALSGYARPEDRQRASAAGFDRHVAKPPNLETLDRLLSEALPIDRS
jgi:two-component system CheB/CheR fusion protein